MDKVAEQKVFNDTFVEMVKSGQTKDAERSASLFTRTKLREESFAEKILTPIPISNDELDKSEDTELLVKWCAREPDQAPAVSVPLGLVPDGFQFKGTNYAVYFSRIMSPFFNKDIDKLRNLDYDIRGVLLENSTKDIASEIDNTFLEKVQSIIGLADTANSLNAMGLPQWVTIAGGLTRTNLANSFKAIQRLKVPFGPMQPDGGSSKGVMLMNNITGMELLKLERGEVGGDEAERAYLEGTPPKTVLGVKTIYTLKTDIVPENTVYFFSSEEFFGKYFSLQPLTVFMENKAYFLQFFQYLMIGMSIGNVRGVVRADFTA